MTVIATAMMIAGCANYQYDDVLQDRVTKEGKTKTEAWFAKNMPQVKLMEVNTMYQVAFNYITNITYGTFDPGNLVATDDSTEIELPSYMFNYETGECFTDVNNGKLNNMVLSEAKKHGIADSLLADNYCESVVNGEQICNQTTYIFYVKHYPEERHATTELFCGLPWNITDSQIADSVNVILNGLKNK